ncbi:MAG: hypothetical protein V3V99_09270 [candidate division Zixibacteria bacterium]
MKKVIPTLFLVVLIFSGSAISKDGDFGLGIIIGEPTGPSFKLWTGGKTALAGAAAWSLDEKNSFHLHLDYLVHNFTAIKVQKGELPVYFGIGGRMKFGEGPDDDIIGVRIPVGLEYLPVNTPLGIFFELVPVLDLNPKTDVDIEGAIGIRYFF